MTMFGEGWRKIKKDVENHHFMLWILGGNVLGGIELTLVAYEATVENLTGFKVFKKNEQIGTIEKRNGIWIGAVLSGCKILTFQNIHFESVVNKMNILIS